MNYKLEGAIKKNKSKFIVVAILWLILAIVFVVPITYALCRASALNQGLTDVIQYFTEAVGSPFAILRVLVKKGLIGNLFKNLFGFTLVYIVIFLIGFLKSAPKDRYNDIEHGSSDWSEHGEQYKILSKKQGIVLAENNYLPVDKKGNVNVMVIGRIRFW